jgi:hypothetical protein
MYYLTIYMEELTTTTNNLSQSNQCLVQVSNRSPLEYRPDALPLEPHYSVKLTSEIEQKVAR